MNCDSCDDPKNSRTAAATGFALMRSCGINVSSSAARHTLLDRTLHSEKADAVLVLHQFADRPDAPVAEVINVIDIAATITQIANQRFQILIE